jgi:NTP pyrophosphatase (non-canonical NTP hydrolase)
MPSTLDDYEEFVLRLASPQSTETPEMQLVLGGLGLCGEAGEFADHVKKVVFHGQEINKEEAVKELGDVMWYLAFAARTIGSSLQEVIDGNVKKLSDRYPDGVFDQSRSHAQGEESE